MGMLDEFYRLKPRLTTIQKDLLNSFYSARKDCSADSLIPSNILREHVQLIEYEIDWGIWVLRRLDEYCMKLRSEKLEADRIAAQNAREQKSNVR